MVEPNFAMFWAKDIPRHVARDADGTTEVLCVAGTLSAGMGAPPAPPPNSWATDPNANLAIWTIKMSPGRAVDAAARLR
jgi:quercetin 2,3-dioxygenase